MVIWIVFTAVDFDVCVDPHHIPHQKHRSTRLIGAPPHSRIKHQIWALATATVLVTALAWLGAAANAPYT
jgi:hypothetical protein